jgi:hypothetical protein
VLACNDNFGRYKPQNSAVLRKVAPPDEAARILIVGKIEYIDRFGEPDRFGESHDLRSTNRFRELMSFENALPAILRQSGLDWRTYITSRLGSWCHGNLNAGHVDVIDALRSRRV